MEDLRKVITEEIDSLLESGERFRKLAAELGAKGAEDPRALAAFIGRKKYGKEGFAELARAGKAHKLKKKRSAA